MALVKQSWQSFIKNWDTTVKISAWYLLIAASSAVATMLSAGGPGSAFLGAIIQIIAAIASIYLSVKIYKAILMIEDQKPVTPVPSALIWKSGAMMLLAGLAMAAPFFLAVVIIIAAIGIGQSLGAVGFIIGLLIAITIACTLFYLLALRMVFVQLRLIDQPTTIKEAFLYSWNLTKGRAWSIFGRMITGGIIFGAFAGAIVIISILLVSMISGVDIGGEMAKQNPSPSVKSISDLIQGIVMAALFPLFYGFNAKLYRDVEKTRT